MQPDNPQPAGRREASPEEQTSYWQQHIESWDELVAGIQESRAAWAAHRAAGGSGPPPGWVSAREYLRERLLRGMV